MDSSISFIRTQQKTNIAKAVRLQLFCSTPYIISFIHILSNVLAPLHTTFIYVCMLYYYYYIHCIAFVARTHRPARPEPIISHRPAPAENQLFQHLSKVRPREPNHYCSHHAPTPTKVLARGQVHSEKCIRTEKRVRTDGLLSWANIFLDLVSPLAVHTCGHMDGPHNTIYTTLLESE